MLPDPIQTQTLMSYNPVTWSHIYSDLVEPGFVAPVSLGVTRVGQVASFAIDSAPAAAASSLSDAISLYNPYIAAVAAAPVIYNGAKWLIDQLS